METCRLSASHIKLGVPLPGNVYDETGKMLLSKGFILTDQVHMEHFLARGMYVEMGVFEAHFRAMAAGPVPPIENKFDPFLARNTLKIVLNRLLRAVLDGSATATQIVEFADQVQAFSHKDSEAAIAASFLDHHDETYSVAHALNTATLSALIAQRLEWPQPRCRSVVCAALTMNLGMFDLQQRLLRQATPLTAVQLEQVHAHPEAAVVALQKIGVDDALWLAAVGQHHEKHDASGYPKHLAEPCEDAQLLRVLDVLGARAMARADRKPSALAQIIRTLFVDEGKGPCAPLVATMVKLLGLYPPGSFVKLENNELAVVFRVSSTNNAPAVAAVTTASGAPTMQPVRRDTHRKGFAITGAVAYDKVSVGYDLGKLWISNSHA